MKKLYLIIISIFIFCFSANSQQVVTGEYFFDTDPSLGIANSISFVADSAVFIDSIPINVTGLAVGYHWVYVRVKDSDNKWSHYRKQRFYVYDNSPIVQPIDTPKLVQAEYWIDSLPIAGTGTLINLTPDDIIFYNDTIQNLQLDTGGHVVSVRVKDGKGNWSLIKTDSVRIENYDLDVFINHSPFFRPNQKQKLQITVRNRGTTTLIDKYLVLDFNEAFDISMTNIPDTLDSVPISNINGALYFPALDKYVTLIWLGELKPLSDINFDVYINFPFFVQRTLDINISVEGPNNTSFQNDYNQTNNLDLIDESYFFCSQRDAILQLKDSIGLPNLLHSSVVDTLKFWYQNHANMFKSPLLLNKITAPFLNFSYGLTISQGLIDSLNKLIYINYQNFSYEDKYPDDTSEFISVINQPIENKISELVTCNCSQNFCVSSIFPPLPQNGSFWLTSACKLRCYCDCVNGKYKPDSRGHGGFDIAMAENDPLFKTQWKKNQTEVRAVFGGNVVHNNYGNSGKSKLIYYVAVETSDTCGNKIVTKYMHLSGIYSSTQLPSTVIAGDLIGYASNTGATNHHLHIEFEAKLNGQDIPASCFLNGIYQPTPGSYEDKSCKDLEESCTFKEEWDNCTDSIGPVESRKCPFIKVDKDKCDDAQPTEALDPNDKVGNKGYTILRFIKHTDEIQYGIFFENVDSATAPAQIVHIIDTLDLTKVDASTFYLESITAGEMLIVIPDSVHIQNLDTTFMEEPINGCYVRAQATFNSSTGVVDFLLTSLDTFPPYAPVQGVLEGFLPPDTTDFHGNGLVSFKVMPVSTIPDDTVIYNTAHIIFDSNPAITTGTWFNTIDRIEPISNVMSLPACTYDTSFVVNWTGTDDGAGIVAYDVYAKSSVDTAFTKWLSYTSLLADTFHGVLNSTYQFYSIAYDSVSNAENKQPLIEASTTICPVGLNFIYNSSDLKIYPNPTTGRLIVEVVLEKSEKINVEIYNLLNQRLISFDGNDSSNKYFKKEIDVSNQPDGVYFIHLKVDGQNITKKFILKK